MGLIKSPQAPSDLSPFSLRDVEEQARALVQRARRAAESLLAEAQKEAELLKQQAHEQGRVEGHKQGLAQGTAQGLEQGRREGHQAALNEAKQQLTQTLTALTSALNQIESTRLELESAGLAEVVQLALAVGRRVTKRQAMLDPAVLSENLKEAMRLALHSADVRIVIHPQQRQCLQKELPALQLRWPNLKHVELIDDQSIQPGGCRVLTRHGEVDAQIDVQLDRVINEMMPEVKE